MVFGPRCGIDSADKCQMPELPCAAWHLHKWFSAPFMLPVNYVYAFSEVIRENRHNRQPRQPDWDGIYHMATAAGGGERCSRLPHNFDLAMFTHLDFSHTRRAAIPYRVDYLPTILSHLLICCLELKKNMCDDATNWKAQAVRLSHIWWQQKNIAISHLQYLKIPERPTCAPLDTRWRKYGHLLASGAALYRNTDAWQNKTKWLFIYSDIILIKKTNIGVHSISCL